MDTIQRDGFLRDLCTAKKVISARVSVGRANAASSVWEIWQNYFAELGLNLFLEAIQDKVPLLQVFAQRV